MDVNNSDGFNAGLNPVQTAVPLASDPNAKANYTWYAGNISYDANRKPVYTPVEFGAISLAPADAVAQDIYGLLGALIIEPQGSSWHTDVNSRAQANITKATRPPSAKAS